MLKKTVTIKKGKSPKIVITYKLAGITIYTKSVIMTDLANNYKLFEFL